MAWRSIGGLLCCRYYTCYRRWIVNHKRILTLKVQFCQDFPNYCWHSWKVIVDTTSHKFYRSRCVCYSRELEIVHVPCCLNPLPGIATVHMLPSELIREALFFHFMTILNILAMFILCPPFEVNRCLRRISLVLAYYTYICSDEFVRH